MTKLFAVLMSALLITACASTDESSDASTGADARKCREEAVTGSRLPKRC